MRTSGKTIVPNNEMSEVKGCSRCGLIKCWLSAGHHGNLFQTPTCKVDNIMATITVLANPRPREQSVSQARQRRRQSTRRPAGERQGGRQRPERALPSSLNDSTAGVADLLQRMSLESEPDHASSQQEDAACTTTTAICK